MADARDLDSIAIIGMAGRFPGAANVHELWNMLVRGDSAIRELDEATLHAQGVADMIREPGYVTRGAWIEDIDRFDAAFFGLSPREAAETDPQHRLLLECAYHALESAGYAPRSLRSPVGVYVGVNRSTYYINNLHPALDTQRSLDDRIVHVAADKSQAATRIAHALNLSGPAIALDTGCSTSLVAVHCACRALLNYECDMALAGGVNLNIPQKVGYHFREGGIQSPDGTCRAFDADARGTVFGNGLGLVVLKRLAEALDDGDDVVAVIRGSAINNDGSHKVSFWSPGVAGQTQVIVAAQQVAGVDAGEISYVEAHGTGTALGDPVEVMALTDAFRRHTQARQFCAITSIKPNVGHLEVTAGIASLIKMALALRHEVVPASVGFHTPNPKIDWAGSPFYVNQATRPWTVPAGRRRIGAVSSFGIGGTNAHAILEQAPARERRCGARLQIWPLSAATAEQCTHASSQLVDFLRENPRDASDVARTLQEGRERFRYRSFAVVDTEQPVETVSFCAPTLQPAKSPRVALLFPGAGSERPGMFEDFYRGNAVFRGHMDECLRLLSTRLAIDMGRVWRGEAQTATLSGTRHAEPLLFSVEYSLAKCFEAAGVEAEAMLGHSFGEYVAACLAGVFSLEDALRLVVARGAATDEFRELVRSVQLRPPQRSFLSNVTGEPIDSHLACDPEYWVQHRLSPVRIASGLASLRRRNIDLLVEVGPGTELSQLARSFEFSSDQLISTESVFDALGRLWQAGVELNWALLRGGQPRRTSLPGYPFEKTRHWIDPERVEHELGAATGKTPALHEEIWERKSEAVSVPSGTVRRWTLIPDSVGWCDRLANALPVADEETGAHVIVYGASLRTAKLDAQASLPELAAFARTLQGLPSQTTRVVFLVSQCADVTGTEALSPNAAMWEAALRVVAAEQGLDCTIVDLPAVVDSVAVERLRVEILATPTNDLIAVRGRYAWQRRFAPIMSTASRRPRIRDGGVYLITGAAGRIGQEFCRYLAARGRDLQLLLTGRRSAEQVLAEPWIAELREASCRIEYRACDAGEREQFASLLEEWLARFGRIDGVMHSAGLPGEGLTIHKSERAFLDVLGPKVAGTEVLLAKLADRSPDFLLLNSSLFSLVGGAGQLDYAAANRFMDIAARSARRDGISAVSVNWDAWRDAGMARGARLAHERLSARAASPSLLGSRTVDGYVRHWTQEEWLVAGHRVLDYPVVPGSAWLEVAVAAGQEELGGLPIVIRDLEFLAALAVPASGVSVTTRLTRSGEVLHGEIVCGRPSGPSRVLVRFRIERLATSAAGPDFESGSLPALPEHDWLKKVHFGEFGKSWHSLVSCRAAAGRVHATFALDETDRSQCDAYTCHPALWDAATGLIPGAILLTTAPEDIYLPEGYREARIYGPLPPRFSSYSRCAAGSGPLTIDVVLVDETGRTVAEIDGLRISRVSPRELRAALSASAQASVSTPGSFVASGIEGRDAFDLFDRILATHHLAQLIVTSGEAGERLERLRTLGRETIERMIQARPVATGAPASTDQVPLQSDLEEGIAALWREILGVEAVGRTDDFFELGGHSLLATQLAARLKQIFAVQIPIELMLEQPTVAAIASLIQTQRDAIRQVRASSVDEALREEGVL